MGNNEAYADFETTVIELYDAGGLTKESLERIGKRYWGKYGDIDSGGSQDLLTHDGKDLLHVVVETMAPDFKPQSDDIDEVDEELYEKFSEITDGWAGRGSRNGG